MHTMHPKIPFLCSPSQAAEASHSAVVPQHVCCMALMHALASFLVETAGVLTAEEAVHTLS